MKTRKELYVGLALVALGLLLAGTTEGLYLLKGFCLGLGLLLEIMAFLPEGPYQRLRRAKAGLFSRRRGGQA